VAIVDIGQIRVAIADRCATLDGLWAYAYPSDAVQVGPAGAALVRDAELDDFVAYHQVGYEPDVRILFDLLILAPTASPVEAGRLLDEYRGVGTERSIVSLLESGGNLGGLGNVTVTGVGPIREYNQGQADARLWEVTFSVEVRAG
jgi:hypothetical protein